MKKFIVILSLFVAMATLPSFSQDKPPEKNTTSIPTFDLSITVAEGNYIVSRLVGAPVKTSDLIHKINSKTELLPADKVVAVSLTVTEANIIIGRLVEAPFKDVATIVYKINDQAEIQLNPKADISKKPVQKE